MGRSGGGRSRSGHSWWKGPEAGEAGVLRLGGRSRPLVRADAPSALRTAFNNNVGVAYECLSASGRKKKPGLDGRTYSELLKRICRDGEAPEEVVAPLLRKIQCRDHEAVPLAVFRAGMLTCFVLLEFVARAGALYRLLEDPGLAMADRRLGQAVLDTL